MKTRIMNFILNSIYLFSDRLNPGNPGSGTVGGNTGNGDGFTGYKASLTSSRIMDNVIKVIGYLGTYLGAGILLVGVIQFLLALKDHDGDSKSKAINYIISGAAFFALGIILNMIFST